MKKVEAKIIGGQISNDAKTKYLLASYLMFVVLSYSGITVSSGLPRTLPSILEGIIVFGINVLGIAKAYDSAGGSKSKDFVAEFTCVYVPAGILACIFVWSLFWGTVLGAGNLVAAMSQSQMQVARNVASVWSDFFGLFAFLSVIAVQFFTYLQIVRSFRRIAAARSVMYNQ